MAFFSFGSKQSRPRRGETRGRVRRGGRGLRWSCQLGIEPLEQRTLLSINIADSPQVAAAIAQAADLTQYTAQQLASTTQWIIGYQAGRSPATLASQVGATFVRDTGVLDDTAIFQFPQGMSPQTISAALANLDGEVFHYPSVALTPDLMRVPNDPYFSDQWHLLSNGQRLVNGETLGPIRSDANVTAAWDIATGRGVVIGIVDDSLQRTHPDLNPGYRQDLSFDFIGQDRDPSPDGVDDNHGTAVAGVAGGRGFNFLGTTGSAPEADLAGLRLIGGPTTFDFDIASALTFKNDETLLADTIQVYNNSWGFTADGVVESFVNIPLTLAALQDGTTNGRDGLGSIILFAAANGRAGQDNTNYSRLTNSRFTIPISAIDHNGVLTSYSTFGASVLVAAQSGEGAINITTTDRTSSDGYNTRLDTPTSPNFDGDAFLDLDYTSTFNGTSSATPLATGVVALMLEANPNLSYRDVMQILVETASLTDPNSVEWDNNGAVLFNGGQGFHVHHFYGFGAINAAAAVTAAKTWTPLLPETAVLSGPLSVNTVIPDGSGQPVESGFTVTSANNIQVEHVEVVFNAIHPFRGDLRIELISPRGTISELAYTRPTDGVADYANWVFSTVRDWGESSVGTWTLRVTDRATGDVGTWVDWQLNLYGVTNYGPRLKNDQVTTLESTAVTISVISNDRDLDGIIRPSSVQVITRPTNGVFSINSATGAITYTPNPGFVGTDTLTYRVLDNEFAFSNIATVTINVVGLNPPVAGDDTVVTAPGTSVTIDILSNDNDFDGVLIPSTVTIVTQPLFGSVSLISQTGAVIYTPDANFTTSDSFTYTVQDNHAATSNVATVTINRSNDAPLSVDDVVATNKNVSITLDVLANDSDFNGPLDRTSIRIVTPSARGTVSINPVNGLVLYTPKLNFAGTDRFQYTVSDEQGATSNIGTVDITVLDVGPPVARDDEFILVPGFGGLLGISLQNDETGTSSATAELVQGTATGQLFLGSDSVFTYNVGANFSGIDSFVYRLREDGQLSNPATVRLISADFNFVRKLYSDILNRSVSDGEILFWVGGMAGGVTRDQVIRAFLASREYRSMLIDEVYQQFLGRTSEDGGREFWLARMDAGASIDLLSASIAATAEYAIRTGLTDAGFVAGVYVDVLGRAATSGDISFWTSVMNNGASREEVAAAFLTTREYQSTLIREYFVDYLNHEPEGAFATDYWLFIFAGTGRREDVQAGILGSFEYFNFA